MFLTSFDPQTYCGKAADVVIDVGASNADGSIDMNCRLEFSTLLGRNVHSYPAAPVAGFVR